MDATSDKPINQEIKVKEATAAEILSLVDNSVDFLSTVNKRMVKSFRQWTRERYGQEWPKTHTQLPCAEHGFSMLIRVFSEDKSRCVLFDTGGSSNGIVENAERMGISLSEIECIVLSHGHYDHFGGLLSAVKAVGKADLPIIVHENMFKTRGSASAKGTVRQYPDFPTEAQLSPARLVSTKRPSLTADSMVCITGEIPRKTSFETGYTQHKAFVSSSWKSDPFIMDERAIAINIKGKGLVVLSGCAHAGIINTISYAQQVTGTEKVYAVMGGFHLAGKEFANRIRPTIEELQRINPEVVVPSHCTGWRAMCTIAKTLPEAFVWNSVGNLYTFWSIR
jgi:7,8-dihydropterin-6-yl-methyl-4-(beta-D-ribofuranosyl)aminobenzene 5'-phosphate synthase